MSANATYCDRCQAENHPERAIFCAFCGKALVQRREAVTLSPLGVWHVTTEGDVEGRSVKDLGVHYGYIDEIARALASSVYYSLSFEPSMHLPPVTKPVVSVEVSLPIRTGTWDMKMSERIAYFEKFLAGRPVHFTEGRYYASVKMVFDPSSSPTH